MANANEVILDLTNYRDRMGSRVMPGRYRVFVEDVELDTTQAGDPMINIWLTIQGGEFDGECVLDRLLPHHKKALFRVVGFMRAIGLPTPKKRMKIIPQQFVGKVLEIDVEDGDPYNGRVKSEVRGYYRVGKLAAQQEGQAAAEAAGVKTATAEDLDDLEAELDASTHEGPDTIAVETEEPKAEGGTTAAADADDGEIDLEQLDLG